MKRFFIAICLFLATASCFAQSERKNVLFIGNSYTSVNDLPRLTQMVAQSMGDELTYESNTPGGCTFAQHCTNRSMTLIQQGTWDVVVLQEQSQLPSFPEWQVERECFPNATRLVEAAYAANPNVEPMFYMTWGRKNGDQSNAQEYPPLGTYEGMDSLLYERYMQMGRDNNASVCPVGRVWRNIRKNHREIELYADDGSHPSMAGSYAAACAFYTMIFHRNPSEIRYTADLDETTAQIIRSTVEEVVFDSLGFWQRQTTVSISKEEMPSISIYPNPTTGKIVISGCKKCDITIFDMQGRQVMQGQDDMSALPSGIYVVSISQPSGTTKCKVVKQ